MRALILSCVALAVWAACDGGAQVIDGGIDAAPDLALTLVDPAKFDCTSLGGDGKNVPARASTVPLSCALDPACRTPQLSGHRGAGGMELSRIAPEDTLAAVRAAIALGVEFVETDPRPTADGVLVNFHDPTVERTTLGQGAIANMQFAQVQALKLKTEGYAGDFSCEKVPAFADVLRTVRGRVVALVDANKTDRVDLLVQAIRDADAIEWAIFDTSSIAKIDAALAIEPKLRVMIRPRTVEEIGPQMDHFAPRVPVIVELEPEQRALGAPIVHMRGSRVMVNVFIEDAAAGLQGTLSGYGKALADGVDILQTDRPDLALTALRRAGRR